MTKLARYRLSVHSSETRIEDPVYSDNLLLVSIAANKLTSMRTHKVRVIDTAEDKILFESVNGKVLINR